MQRQWGAGRLQPNTEPHLSITAGDVREAGDVTIATDRRRGMEDVIVALRLKEPIPRNVWNSQRSVLNESYLNISTLLFTYSAPVLARIDTTFTPRLS